MHIMVVDVEVLARNWWAVLLRGVAGIVFGILTLLSPAVSLTALVLLRGAYAFVDGINVRRGSLHSLGPGRWPLEAGSC